MGRRKTISDEEILRVARDVFRTQGHTATTRAIAEAAGISEAILYQRFGSKEELFFRAMHPHGPDLDTLLGPLDPPDDARAYLQTVVVRIRKYFSDAIPQFLRVMMHPSFDPASLPRAQPHPENSIHHALAARLTSLARRQRIASSADAIARLLVSLAHDSALRGVIESKSPTQLDRELRGMVDLVWEGVREQDHQGLEGT